MPRVTVHSSYRKLAAIVALATLSACTTPDGTEVSQDGIFDPHEEHNRRTHAFNKDVDRAILRPVATSYSTVVPDGIEDNVSHFANNLSVPGAIVNQVLQGDLNNATRNLVRFSINSTFGFAGLADVASDWGLPERDADFGQTLAVWGVPQGAYVELPLLGPSTERATAGMVVDLVLDPLNALHPADAEIARNGKVLAGVGARGRFAETVDSILYDSADSYAATRDIYLQNRAFELGKAGVEEDIAADPYADIFGE